jgi:hypothetical protein
VLTVPVCTSPDTFVIVSCPLPPLPLVAVAAKFTSPAFGAVAFSAALPTAGPIVQRVRATPF